MRGLDRTSTEPVAGAACAVGSPFTAGSFITVGAFLLVAMIAFPAEADAQVRGSERGTVSQVADGTTITIDYSRPRVRGREPVFGGVVGWGHTWTPGANQATTFETSKDVTLNELDVPAGRYSVWMVPAEGDWEVVLDPNDDLFHTRPPATSSDQIRFTVTPDESPFTEALTWDFPVVKPTGMMLRFRWATTSVPLRILVQPTRVLTVDADEAHAVVGEYDMTFEGPPPPEVPEGSPPPAMKVELRYEGEQLLGTVMGGPPGLPSEFALLPVARFVFNPAWMEDGEIFETEVDMYFEFNVDRDRAEGFDVRGLEDRLMMRGSRTN